MGFIGKGLCWFHVEHVALLLAAGVAGAALAGGEAVRFPGTGPRPPIGSTALGWSNGGSTVLHALRPDAPGREADGPRFRFAVAFYPGCAPLARSAYRPTAPLLIQTGGDDDWTPSRYCVALAGQAPEGTIEIDVHAGAHHSFDRVGSGVRERPDVSNPNRPGGRGATVGAHPEARRRAIARTTEWLENRDR